MAASCLQHVDGAWCKRGHKSSCAVQKSITCNGLYTLDVSRLHVQILAQALKGLPLACLLIGNFQ